MTIEELRITIYEYINSQELILYFLNRHPSFVNRHS